MNCIFRLFHVNFYDRRFDNPVLLVLLFFFGLLFSFLCYVNWAPFEKSYCQIIDKIITINSLLLTLTVATLSILYAHADTEAHLRVIKTAILIDVVFGLLLLSADLCSLIFECQWGRSIVIGFEVPYFISVGASLVAFLEPNWHAAVKNNDEKWKSRMIQTKRLKASFRKLCDFMDRAENEVSFFSQVYALSISKKDKKFLLDLYDSVERINIGKSISDIEEKANRLEALMKSIMIDVDDGEPGRKRII